MCCLKRIASAFILTVSGILACLANENQNIRAIDQISPPSWFIGLGDEHVELIIKGQQICQYAFTMDNYSGVSFIGKSNSANPNICYVTIKVDKNANTGNLVFKATASKNRNKNMLKYFTFTYTLRKRNVELLQKPGVSSKDIMYLLMPDRFANGNPNNDLAKMSFPDKVNRAGLKTRHGGDLKGISNHLEYIKSIGITSLWLNPVQTNDQDTESYHGYAITNHYEIDPRFGNNSEYFALCRDADKLGIKMVMDIIPNHLGYKHWMFLNPDTGWFNDWDSFTRTNYRAYGAFDPNVPPQEKKLNFDGWFDTRMPDINQRNRHIAKYLDQLYLWWIESAQLSGLRIDTYPYCDLNYMNHLNDLVLKNYPNLCIFGETWVNGTPAQVAFVKNKIAGMEQNSLPGVTDFQLCWAMQEAVTKDLGWTDGLNKIYQILADDYLYVDPLKNVIFLDNHDLSRITSIVKGDFNKWKMAITLLYTLRGIPCLYYGTEIMMQGETWPSDALVRKDFPGGWANDTFNKFEEKGRNELEKKAFNYAQQLAKIRNEHEALQFGKTLNYAGQNGVYFYVRYTDKERILLVYNSSSEKKKLPISRLVDCAGKTGQAKNLITGDVVNINQIEIESWGTGIYLLE